METMIRQTAWYQESEREAVFPVPAAIAAAPYVGFRWAELSGIHLWMHHQDFVAAEEIDEQTSLIRYLDGGEEKTFHALCDDIDVDAAVEYVRKQLDSAERDPLPEICSWLRNNPHSSGFASNRFGATENALAFFDQLYQAGAAHIGVEVMRDEDEGPYADTALITLPKDVEKVRAIWQLLNDDARNYGCCIDSTDYQNQFTLWWD
jgi:hypothetical protein